MKAPNLLGFGAFGISRGQARGQHPKEGTRMASIEYRMTGDGPRWRVVWREDGSKQQRSYADEGDAGRFKAKVEAYGNHWPPGEDPRPAAPVKSLTFAEWAEKAVANRTRANERTKADYRRDLEHHFTLLADVRLEAMSADDVTAWLNDRRGAGLAEKTIRNLHGFASSLYVDALAQHPPIVSHNPFAGKLPDRANVRTEEMVFLTKEEFHSVLRWVREEYVPLVRLLYGTGLRYGEATALTVGDVELLAKRKALTVTKAWKRTGPAAYVVGEPKTQRSRRTLGLSDELVELLIPLVSGRSSSELLFAGKQGLRVPHTEVYKRGWAPAVARSRVCDRHWEPQRDGRNQRPRLPEACDCAGVLAKTPRIHDLRHSHVAWLISEGVALPAISRRLGHSSITITFDRYGHLDPSLDEAINLAVDRALVRSLD